MGRKIKYLEKDLIGRRFGRWTVLYETVKSEDYRTFRCKCDCGNEYDVRLYDLLSGKSQRCRHCSRVNVDNKVHMTKEGCQRLHRVWSAMISRCHNPNDKDYASNGGRGISVFEGWRYHFKNFRDWAYQNGYDENVGSHKQLIYRLDRNSDYTPTNCIVCAQRENFNPMIKMKQQEMLANIKRKRCISCDTVEEIIKMDFLKRMVKLVKVLSRQYHVDPDEICEILKCNKNELLK